jgi:hypothetical protein
MMRNHDLNKIAAQIVGLQCNTKFRTAGVIQFQKDQGPLRRDIRVQGFKWNPDVHRNLAKTLWAIERAHSYGIAALRLFSKMNSSEFSPDGLLGGKGYIQKVKDLRSQLSQAVEVMSAFADTLHDEVNADHWHSAIEDDSITSDIIEQAVDVKSHPEDFVTQSYETEVPQDPSEFDLETANPSPDDFNPFDSDEEDAGDEEAIDDWGWDGEEDTSPGQSQTSSSQEPVIDPDEPGSKLPDDDGPQGEACSAVEMLMDTTGERHQGNYSGAIQSVLHDIHRRYSSVDIRFADSSVDPSTLPGPRVMHIGPGESPEEFGYSTELDERPSDDPLGEGFSQLDRIYEDEAADGVTGFGSFAMQLADTRISYSWLPGSRNEKMMPYYDLNVTEDDVLWMRANDAPDPPFSPHSKLIRPPTDPLWELRQDKHGEFSAD